MWSRSETARVTHKKQALQSREAREGPGRDARDLVALLLREREDETSEAGMSRASGMEGCAGEGLIEGAGARRRALRTRSRDCRAVRPVKVPAGMLAIWLLFCSERGRFRRARWA